MNKNIMIDALGYLDDDLVEKHFRKKEELSMKKARNNKKRWVKWGSMAACVAVVIFAVVLALPLLGGTDGYPSVLALTVYAADGTENSMELDQGFLNSGVSGETIFGKDVPTFEFYVAPVGQEGEGGIFEKYDIELAYNGKVVEGKDEHIRLTFVIPVQGVSGVGRYCIIGWFEETTDVIVTLKDKNSGEVVERMTVNVSYSEADTAYKLTLVELYSIADEK